MSTFAAMTPLSLGHLQLSPNADHRGSRRQSATRLRLPQLEYHVVRWHESPSHASYRHCVRRTRAGLGIMSARTMQPLGQVLSMSPPRADAKGMGLLEVLLLVAAGYFGLGLLFGLLLLGMSLKEKLRRGSRTSRASSPDADASSRAVRAARPGPR